VISAKDDSLQSIKTYLLNAAIKQGLCKETQVTALADGAKNCSIVSYKPDCDAPRVCFDWFIVLRNSRM